MPYPALRLLVQVVLGIMIGHAFPQLVLMWLILAAIAIVITLTALALERYVVHIRWCAVWTVGYLLGVPLGLAAYTAAVYEMLPENTVLKFANEDVVVLARAETDAKTKNKVAQWTADVEKVVLVRTGDTLGASGKVRVRRYMRDSSAIALTIGKKFWLQGRLERPKPAMNQSEFDYRAFLAEKEIDLLLVSSDKETFIKTGQTE
ncbi:MAG: DUF4131 domain-containing protein, partial [Candidatus Thermochlorobacter sp.]